MHNIQTFIKRGKDQNTTLLLLKLRTAHYKENKKCKFILIKLYIMHNIKTFLKEEKDQNTIVLLLK